MSWKGLITPSLFFFYSRLNQQVVGRKIIGSTKVPEANFSLYIQSALETKAETSWGVSPEYLSCTFQARLLANLNLLRSCRKGDKFWKPVWSQFPVAARAVWVTCTWVVQTTPHPYQQAWPPVPQESVLVTPKHLCPAAQKPPLKQPCHTSAKNSNFSEMPIGVSSVLA